MDEIADLGQHLKNIREQKRVPAAQVAQELKAKLEFIQAIENNEYEKLPAPIYVKGFLRSYAKYLGLDPDQILASYNKNHPDETKQVLVLEGEKMPGIGFPWNKIKSHLWIPVVVLVLAAVIIGLFVVFTRTKKSKPLSEKPVASEVKPIVEKHVSRQLVTPLATPLALNVQAADAVWMRVQADEKLIFEGILTKNEKKDWTAKQEFKLRIGNPGKLNLTINDQFLGNITPYGGPVNIVINKEGMKVAK